MVFDDRLCEGIACDECSFHKGLDICLLAYRIAEVYEFLTDKEQRIFLKAMSREQEVCKSVDANTEGDICLDNICNSIIKKVIRALW